MNMSAHPKQILFWAPRVIVILIIGLVSMFALDVFEEKLGFWSTLAHLIAHLIPSFVLTGALVLAWHRERAGAAAFAAIGLAFLVIVRGPIWAKAIFASPCLLVAGLFLLNWRSRAAAPPDATSNA